jgi:hypothetical protein
VSDEAKARRGGSTGQGEAVAAPTLPPNAQAAAPVTDAGPTAPPRQAVDEGDSSGRTKVPLSWALEHGERVLGIPKHVLVAAFEGDEREELTLNAVRKTVDQFQAKVQNPDAAEEA